MMALDVESINILAWGGDHLTHALRGPAPPGGGGGSCLEGCIVLPNRNRKDMGQGVSNPHTLRFCST